MKQRQTGGTGFCQHESSLRNSEENLKILLLEDGYTELIRPKVKDGFMVFGVKSSFGTLVVFSDTENGGGEVDEKTLDHIAVTRKKAGEDRIQNRREFEPEGMVVTTYYSDGTKEV